MIVISQVMVNILRKKRIFFCFEIIFFYFQALQALLHGLVTNTTCKTLELKGNGIQGTGTEALAKVLRRNQTLRKYVLLIYERNK